MEFKIPLTRGMYAIVDEEDYAFLSLFKWSFHKKKEDRTGYAIRSGYCRKTQKRSRIGMHRFLLKASKGQIVDHINHNGLDNRRTNLRFADATTNNYNKRASRKKRSGNFKGVSLTKDRNGIPKYWIARITADKKRIYLGAFRTEELAAEAYHRAAKLLHKEFLCR